MVERTPILDALTYAFLMLGICIVGFPIFYTVVAATLPLEEVAKVPMPLVPGDQFWVNVNTAWETGNLGQQLMNSFIMASGITIGKIVVSMLGAFSIVYFDYRFRKVAFAAVFCTLMLPVEVRILPTYEIAANIFGPLQWFIDTVHLNSLIQWWVGNDFEIALEWSLLDSYTGLILPLVASATCTFLFRQFFLTVPEELCEAAKLDGASAMMFFRKILSAAFLDEYCRPGGHRVRLRLEPVPVATSHHHQSGHDHRRHRPSAPDSASGRHTLLERRHGRFTAGDDAAHPGGADDAALVCQGVG